MSDLSASRQLAEERLGPRPNGISDEEWAERLEEHMPRANEIPTALTPDAISAREERKARALRPHSSGNSHNDGPPILGAP